MPTHFTRKEEFAVITLDRPEALNALSFEVVADIARFIDEAEGSDARALIVTGAGTRAFCAGADISELMGRSIEAEKAGAERGQRAFAKLDTLRIPSLGLINGYALGGGLELAMACTFRICVPKARLGLPEIKLGLIPGYGGTQRLPRLVGEARALELVMSGRMVEAEEALAIGLVGRIVEGEPLAEAKTFMRQFTGFGLPALRFAREAVRRAGTTTLAEGLAIEADLNTLAFETEDAAEGTAAFLEKRQANFKDR